MVNANNNLSQDTASSESQMMDTSEDSINNNETYGDMHQMVLQGFMSAGFLDAKGVKKMFVGACKSLNLDLDSNTTMEKVRKVVGEINERIKPYDMAIRSASCELSKKKYYIFLVTVEKPIMKLQTLFSKGELEIFQKIMSAVLGKYDNFAVPHPDCLNFAREIESRSCSIEMAEAFIKRMITWQYLAKYYLDNKGKDYEITIGIRAIREFEPWLRDMYKDVMTSCHLCRTIMLHGYQCAKCTIFVHRACFDKYLEKCTTCPNCKSPWSEKNMVKRKRQIENGGGSRGTLSSATQANTSKNMPQLHPMNDSSSTNSSPRRRQNKSPEKVEKTKASGNKKTTRAGRKRKASRKLSSSEEEEEEDEDVE